MHLFDTTSIHSTYIFCKLISHTSILHTFYSIHSTHIYFDKFIPDIYLFYTNSIHFTYLCFKLVLHTSILHSFCSIHVRGTYPILFHVYLILPISFHIHLFYTTSFHSTYYYFKLISHTSISHKFYSIHSKYIYFTESIPHIFILHKMHPFHIHLFSTHFTCIWFTKILQHSFYILHFPAFIPRTFISPEIQFCSSANVAIQRHVHRLDKKKKKTYSRDRNHTLILEVVSGCR